MPLIILCALCAGKELCSRSAERERLLSGLCRFMYAASDSIRMSLTPLDRIIEDAAAEDDAPMFLSACADRLRRGDSFPEAWRAAAGESPDTDLLSEAELAELERLGGALGHSDVKGELALLGHALDYFCERRDETRAELREKSKMYMSCSVLAGLTVVLLLL